MSGQPQGFRRQQRLGAVSQQQYRQEFSAPAVPSGQSVATQDALTDETSQPSAYSTVAGFSQASSHTGVMGSTPHPARQPRAASYRPRPGKPQSSIDGVQWQTRYRRWYVDITVDKKRHRVPFKPADYGDGIEVARHAAEECAAQIRAGSYRNTRAPAAYQSEVTGVIWDSYQRRWCVEVKDPGGQKAPIVTFCIAKYGNDIERARRAAEECAEQIKEGIYVPRPMRRAEYRSGKSGVTWEKARRRWQVDVAGPDGTKRQLVFFAAANYGDGGDVEQARRAAVECAEQIQAGTYEYRELPRAEHQSEVEGVSWDTSQKKWRVKLKGRNETKRRATTFAPENYGGIEQARKAAEECAAQIRAGTYVRRT